MATAIIYSKTGAKKETPAKLNAKVFGADANHGLISLAYRAYLANGRVAGPKVLTRGLVRGGGKKPHKQKGTGRARAGSSRIAQWRGGGVVFGPTGEENHALKLPVKAKRAAIRQALSLQASDKKIVLLEAFDGGEGKVKPTLALLDKLRLEGVILLVVAEKTPAIDRATRNIAGVTAVSAKYLNVFSIMNADWIVMTDEVQAVLADWLGDK